MPAPVTSVFGRLGAVVAVLNDYAASLVDNDSSVSGATVKDALDWLQGLVDTLFAALAGKAPASLTVDNVTGSRTLLATDNNTLLECNSASAIVLTVDGGVMSAGDVVPIAHRGAGAVSVAQGSGGMTITSRGSLTSTAGTGSYCALVFASSTRAYFVGDRA